MPFCDAEGQSRADLIIKGSYTFPPEYWSTVSDEGMMLVYCGLVGSVSVHTLRLAYSLRGGTFEVNAYLGEVGLAIELCGRREAIVRGP